MYSTKFNSYIRNTKKNSKKARKGEEGFSMIELTVGMVIVGVLSSIAIPAFTKQIDRSKLTEANQLADAALTDMNTEYQLKGANFDPGVSCPEAPAAKFFNYTCSVNGSVLAVTATGTTESGRLANKQGTYTLDADTGAKTPANWQF